MTQPGYIDYARTNLAAGYLLAGGSQAFKTGTVLFKSYVGSWPYINSFWNAVGGTAHDSIQLLYYSDSTFTSLVAQQISVRDTNGIGYRQYATLSPWLQIQVIPDITTDNTVCLYAFYGNTQKTTSAKIGSLDSAFLEASGTIAANTATPFGISKIYPGDATLTLYPASTAYEFDLQRWDYASASWKTFWRYVGVAENVSQSFRVSLPDAPIQAILSNLSSGAATMAMYMMPSMD